MTLTIYRNDGTIQCDPDSKPRPLQDDRNAIESIGVKILGDGRHDRLPILVPAVCGAATGWANIFEVDDAHISRTQLFELSRHGFRIWHFAARVADRRQAGDDDPFPLPLVARMLQQASPDRLSEIVGYRLRVYHTGDALTDDFLANRLNIETDTQQKILAYWFG